MRTTLLLLGCAVLLAGCSVPGPQPYSATPHAKNWFAKMPGETGNTDCPPVDPVAAPGYQIPKYKCIEEPIYEECRVPIWGYKTVPVYAERRVPVTMPTSDLRCRKCEREAVLWHKKERVQVGVKRVRACIGYKTEKRQVGTCRKQVQVGWETCGGEGYTPGTGVGPVARATQGNLP